VYRIKKQKKQPRPNRRAVELLIIIIIEVILINSSFNDYPSKLVTTKMKYINNLQAHTPVLTEMQHAL
jgi:hypothetical protein